MVYRRKETKIYAFLCARLQRRVCVCACWFLCACVCARVLICVLACSYIRVCVCHLNASKENRLHDHVTTIQLKFGIRVRWERVKPL